VTPSGARLRDVRVWRSEGLFRSFAEVPSIKSEGYENETEVELIVEITLTEGVIRICLLALSRSSGAAVLCSKHDLRAHCDAVVGTMDHGDAIACSHVAFLHDG
jgi:hypothetical protein